MSAATTLLISLFPVFAANAQAPAPSWNEVSSATGAIPAPPGGPQQTSLAAGDLDNDGDQDLVLASRGGSNSVVIYRQSEGSWDTFIVESEGLGIEAGGKIYDVDQDGWADIVMAGDFKSNKIWWWKNPGATGWGTDWQRFTIKNSGGVKHHDLGFGDFDSDGTIEIAYWNQGTKGSLNNLHVGDLPANPTAVSHWPTTVVIDASTTSEGMVVADVDRDGDEDLVAGGHLIIDGPGNTMQVSVVSGAEAAYQWAAGDLIPGGHLELVASSGDAVGGLAYFSWNGAAWLRTDLLGSQLSGPWDHGHSLEVGDVNGDGLADIFSAEMALEAGPSARSVVMYGDGLGGFQVESVSTGVDNHESILVDLDNDGDLDIASKPFNQSTPAFRLYINSFGPRAVGPWTRHHIGTRSTRAAWVRHGDINGDGLPDLISGNAWHQNPGSIDGVWVEHRFGSRLTNTIEVLDLDGDGDLDVFGSGRLGTGIFAWAENHGSGSFTTHANIPNGAPNFAQGVGVQHTPSGIEILIAWNDRGYGIDKILVPADPASTTWTIEHTDHPSMGEAFEIVDVDRDGDLDLLQGHMWSRNDGGGSYTEFTFYSPTRCCFAGSAGPDDRLPDRVVAADVNGDGRLDVVATHEHDATNSVAWYEQPGDPTQQWTRRTIFEADYPLHSLDVADVDGDGDLDVVTAEHDSAGDNNGRTLLFQNVSGDASDWRQLLIHDGESNHDGTQFADLDLDGDLDVYTIGWRHDGVVIHENLSSAIAAPIWHDDARRYRIDLTHTAGPTGAFERPAVTEVNLTGALSSAGGAGSVNHLTLRVIEVDDAGQMVEAEVPFQFDPAPGFSATSNGVGDLVVLMTGDTAPSTTRNYQLYFDVIGSAAPTVPVAPRITTTPGVIDEGARTTRVDTPNGIWFYDMDGGGFTSLVDSTGLDWIGYSTAEKAAGEFRGIPNLVTPNDGGYFHPGRLNATSVLRSSGPLRTTINTEIPGTEWAMTWHIYAEYATGAVTSKAGNYYFQYEGVPGGSLGPEDVVHHSGVTIGAFDSFEGDLANPEWMAAADTAVGRSLLVTNDGADNITDSYRDHQDLMTVMVFGRPNGPATSLLSDVGTNFTVELVNGASLSESQSAAVKRTSGSGESCHTSNLPRRSRLARKFAITNKPTPGAGVHHPDLGRGSTQILIRPDGTFGVGSRRRIAVRRRVGLDRGRRQDETMR